MKKILLLLMLLSTTMVNAQDVIVLKDGSTILSKVTDVSSSEVKYKKHSNADGPTYTIPSSTIQVINYENGERESFDKKEIKTSESKRFSEPISNTNSIYVQWNPSKYVPNQGDSYSFTGFTIGYSYGLNIVPSVPLFLELGAALQYSFYY